MNRSDLIQLVVKAVSIPLPMRAFAIAAINLADNKQIESISEIFSEAESVFKTSGVEGLKKFLVDRGVPPEGVALIERIAPYASQAAESHNPI